MGKNEGEERYKRSMIDSVPLEYMLLVLSAIMLLLVSVTFFIVPPEVKVSRYQTPVLSFFAALVVAAIGNILVGFIQKGVSREAARALTGPINDLTKSVEKLHEIQDFFAAGLVGVYPNRSAALQRFRGEIEREDETIDFVGTSLLGCLDPAEENLEKRSMQQLLANKRKSGVRIRALLMHPAYGEFRERVENRERAAVAKDIQATLRYLVYQTSGGTVANGKAKDGNKAEIANSKQEPTQTPPVPLLSIGDVRLYPGVITAMAIITSRSMLINVSTLHGPVYNNLTLVIEDTGDPTSVFKRLRENHFGEPWRSEKTIRLSGDNGRTLRKLLDLDFSSGENRFEEGGWPPTIPNDGLRADKQGPDEGHPDHPHGHPTNVS